MSEHLTSFSIQNGHSLLRKVGALQETVHEALLHFLPPSHISLSFVLLTLDHFRKLFDEVLVLHHIDELLELLLCASALPCAVNNTQPAALRLEPILRQSVIYQD